jgi:hypothetical protein
MKYLKTLLLFAFLIFLTFLVFKEKGIAASGDASPGFLATYSTAKTSACVKGSIAYSRTRVFLCTSTSTWKKATVN